MNSKDKYPRYDHFLILSCGDKVWEKENLQWYNKHFFKNTKKIHFLALAVSLLLLAMVPTQSVSAAQLTIPITTTGSQTFTYRDISNLSPTPDPTISYEIRSGVLTITDFNGDLVVSSSTRDTITATVGSDPVVLTESGVNAVFNAELVLSSSTNVIYNPDPPESARASATLVFSSTGDLIISDDIIDSSEVVNLCFRPVTHIVEYTLANDAALGPTSTSVKISWANAKFVPADNPLLLQMYYKKPGFGWALVTINGAADPSSHNLAAKTVTSNPSFRANPLLPPVYAGTITTGKFVLGYDTGCGGGGAGGLVRPGLVLNVLAGLGNFGGAAIDKSPPSLVFNRPSSGLDSAGAIFGNLFAPDPFEPISPTADSSFNVPLKVNNNGYQLTGYANTIEPEQVSTGENVDLTLSFLDVSSVQHMAVHFVDDSKDELSDTDPMIIFDNGNVIKSDPQGILGNEITISTSKEGMYSKFNFGFSFNEPTKRHLMITAWDEARNSGNTKIFNAFDVSGQSIPQEENHVVLHDLSQYMITPDGDVIDIQAQNALQQKPASGFVYSESLGRLDRHDMAKLYDAIDNEQKKATDVIIDNFGLDTSQRFIPNDEVKPYDKSRKASEMTWCGKGIGCGLDRENKELMKKLSWQEHLRAYEKLMSLLVESKYHTDKS